MKARRAVAKKFGLGRKFEAHTFPILLRYKKLSQFTHFLEDFGQKMVFVSNTVFTRQEVHYYMAQIAYYTELNLQICNYAQKQCICRKKSKYAPD